MGTRGAIIIGCVSRGSCIIRAFILMSLLETGADIDVLRSSRESPDEPTLADLHCH